MPRLNGWSADAVRIAFLCKRRYMGKDVIDDRYARLYEIPYQLATLGNEVKGFCLGYQGQSPGEWTHDAGPGSLAWTAESIARFGLHGAVAYALHLRRALRSFKPDLLIGASDIPHVVLTGWLSKRLGIPYVVDLYDNFEAFGQARIPGMKTLLRRAVRDASLVTATSEPLARLVRDSYLARGVVVSMPSTVNQDVFRRLDRTACRTALGLPLGANLVGTAGALMQDRGIGALYDAWRMLEQERQDVHLVLAGPIDPEFLPPLGARVHYLGLLTHAETAQLFGALDVGVIYLKDSLFGRFCFPQKAYEMLSCNLSIVAARVGAVSDLLADYPDCLYPADNALELKNCLTRQLLQPAKIDVPIRGWNQLINESIAARIAYL